MDNLSVQIEIFSSVNIKEINTQIQIEYGIYQSPFGNCLIAAIDQGICSLLFLDSSDKVAAFNLIHSEWKNLYILENQERINGLGDRLFNPVTVGKASVNLYVQGTEFQLQVWRGLLKIPFGQTMTYQELAVSIGRPTSARAVGNAVGRNPVGYLIPCHRVIRSSGAMGGYCWGLDRKAAILAWEAKQAIATNK